MLYRIRPTAVVVLKLKQLMSISSFSTQTSSAVMSRDEQAKFNFDEIFTEENKRRTIEELTSFQSDSVVENFMGNNVKRSAAVLIPLCYDLENRPSLLFNLRSKTMNKHKGEICFPGGAVDPEDNGDVIVAALRETQEELGIKPEDIEIWATLPYIPTVTALMRVAPVLGFIKTPFNPHHLNLNPAEVEVAFTVPVEHLCDEKNWSSTEVSRRIPLKYSHMPAFDNLGQFIDGEDVKLWGLTAIITHMLLMSLVPQVYRREMPMSTRVVPKPRI